MLIAGHVVYYFACIVEGFDKGAFFADATAYAGLALYVFSIVILYYVIYSLRHVWTVKLIVAPKEYHTINDSFLFRSELLPEHHP